MREFVTALNEEQAEQAGEDLSVEFKIGGAVIQKRDVEYEIPDRVVTAYKPGSGQMAFLAAAVSRHAGLVTQIAGVIDFFIEALDEDDATYVRDRLLDRHDPFGMDNVYEIMEFLVEEWSGRPTPSASASSRSQANTGRTSKRRTPVST